MSKLEVYLDEESSFYLKGFENDMVLKITDVEAFTIIYPIYYNILDGKYRYIVEFNDFEWQSNFWGKEFFNHICFDKICSMKSIMFEEVSEVAGKLLFVCGFDSLFLSVSIDDFESLGYYLEN